MNSGFSAQHAVDSLYLHRPATEMISRAFSLRRLPGAFGRLKLFDVRCDSLSPVNDVILDSAVFRWERKWRQALLKPGFKFREM